jgi:hypothetical protein
MGAMDLPPSGELELGDVSLEAIVEASILRPGST